MQYYANGLAGSIAGVEIESLQWTRRISAQTVGSVMIRNVRAGLPPLGRYADRHALVASLDTVDFPERGTSRDVRLGARLAQLGNHPERDMARFLSLHGLAGLGESSLESPGPCCPEALAGRCSDAPPAHSQCS
ncbi:hypothetical protein E0H73_45390 [Kribbella pittospori]|uniref:Uncharacterized protein n=1 Tax=Kribbella pittospori TaxID=722689 RepID=A0A4R0JDG4_9ACTN|nr:hypothetical protein [Kribbella pittospori]TCC44781.1 hypothetical protein E0H73_45390 [Kribbella pittospori]